jgi:alpha-1,2-mannosyltransferase
VQTTFTHFMSFHRLRGILAAWFAAAFGVFAFAGIMGLNTSRGMAAFFAVGIAAGVAWLAWKRLRLTLDNEAISATIGIVFLLSSILSLVQLTRLCVFIVNPAAVAYALGPHRGIGLSIRHLCMTAYFVAAQSATAVPNIYDENKLYSLPDQDPDAPRKPRTIGQFDIDAYEYPPPFLLLPRTLAIVAPQFLSFRMLWFALDGVVVLIGLIAVSEIFDPFVRTRVLLLSPLVLGAEITIGTLQVGNVQAAVIALAMLAMVLFARGRCAAGGVLLAFVIVSKLFPGLLLVYLAGRREWRAVVWTVGMGAGLVCISLIDMGSAPFGAFLHHLPRLLSGEAFPVFRRPGGVATNLSVPGFLFKLKLFGLPNGSFEAMKIVGTIYTVIVLAVTAALGTQRVSKSQQPLIWLTVLILASLRSPFLPQYGLFPVLWLLILLAATAAPSVRTLCLSLMAWLALNIVVPVNGADPRLVASMALVSQAIIGILIVLTVRQQQRLSVAMSPV